MDRLDPPLLSTAMLSFATLKYDPGIPMAHAMYTNMASNLPLFEAKDLATTAQVRGGWGGPVFSGGSVFGSGVQ